MILFAKQDSGVGKGCRGAPPPVLARNRPGAFAPPHVREGEEATMAPCSGRHRLRPGRWARLGLGVALGLVLVLGVGPLSAAELSGTVEITAGDALVTDAVVTYEPEGGAKRPAPETLEVLTRDRRFQPRVTTVPLGSHVRFPNEDPIKHNVFSVSPGNRFDLGLMGAGKGKAIQLDTPGLVRVFCNVHRQMAAYVLVVTTPFVARPGADGRFVLRNLPAGRGTVTVWHERSGSVSRAVRVPSEETFAFRLDATQPSMPQHANKFGRPYTRDPDDGDYR